MLNAAFLALGDLMSPPFRSVLLKAVGLTIILFAAVLLGAELALSQLVQLSLPWAQSLLQVGTGLALLAAFFFLMAPVTAMFAGIFLDDVAARVEALHYPRDPPGQALSFQAALWTGVRFGALVLLVNLAALPLVFTGIGALVLVAVNAYLISREYFEMAAMRHMSAEEARKLRRLHAPQITLAGVLPAFGAMVPVFNVLVPLFATAYFTHIFKMDERSSP